MVRELRESPRQPGRYLLMLSNGEKFVLGVEVLAETGATRVGASIDVPRLERLRHASAVTALVDKALNSLAHGRRTRRELEIRLRRVQPDAALIREALDRLEANGVLNDAEVARGEAASRLRRGEAPARVRQTLRRKGVDARQTEVALTDAISTDGFDERAACRQQADKRYRALRALDAVVARRRLMAFLLRRGFSGSVVRDVVREVTRGDD